MLHKDLAMIFYLVGSRMVEEYNRINEDKKVNDSDEFKMFLGCYYMVCIKQ